MPMRNTGLISSPSWRRRLLRPHSSPCEHAMKAEPARASEAVETHELAKLSAIDLLDGYRAGRFTPRDVIEDVIAALESTDVSCNVVVTPMYEQARAAADEATAAWASGRKPGLLAGVPVTIKDLVYVAGVPAFGGAPATKEF